MQAAGHEPPGGPVCQRFQRWLFPRYAEDTRLVGEGEHVAGGEAAFPARHEAAKSPFWT